MRSAILCTAHTCAYTCEPWLHCIAPWRGLWVCVCVRCAIRSHTMNECIMLSHVPLSWTSMHSCTVSHALQRTLHTYPSSYHKQFHLNCIHTMIIDYNSLKLCIMIWWLIWVHVHRSAASFEYWNWLWCSDAMNKTGITYYVQDWMETERKQNGYVREFRMVEELVSQAIRLTNSLRFFCCCRFNQLCTGKWVAAYTFSLHGKYFSTCETYRRRSHSHVPKFILIMEFAFEMPYHIDQVRFSSTQNEF